MMKYVNILVNPLISDVRPEDHPSLEVEVHGTGRPGVVDDGRHAGPVQGEFPHVRLVSEYERGVTLPGLALLGVLIIISSLSHFN